MSSASTPLSQQYYRIRRELKEAHPQAILLFRLGDFYECFEEDAEVVARDLEIVLTGREMGKGRRIPMAGIPAHSAEGYLSRLIRKGHKVAVCEQLTEPGNGLVERGVVRIMTPGTVVEPTLLDQKANNYLAALVAGRDRAGLAAIDVSTGDFTTTELPLEDLGAELERLSPSELLVPEGGQDDPPFAPGVITPLAGTAFQHEEAREHLLRHFGVSTLEAYGCEHLPLATAAAGAALEYVERTHRDLLPQITQFSTYDVGSYITLDPQTRRNLELFEGGRWGSAGHSLLSVLDLTCTAMGARMLRRWVGQPLRDLAALEQRLDRVEALLQDTVLRSRVREVLADMGDLERLVRRVSAANPQPREVLALRRALERLPELKALLEGAEPPALAALGRVLHPCGEITKLVAAALEDDPAPSTGEGEVIRAGFSPELDELRAASRDSRAYIAGLEQRERERTGIRSLRVGYNRVFGYYLEVSKANLSLVPEHYIRKQTLTGGERYITPELKEYESQVLNAGERMAELEASLFRQVCRQIAQSSGPVMESAHLVAQVDTLAALAEAGYRYGYVRPHVDGGPRITIRDGRHPVVERTLPPGSFVANDTELSLDDAQIAVLTGPNMAGKSTYIRQVALIVLMAQIGSFVPAREATIGLVDRIFTRVGLQDDLATGQSTFMVEMVETATILNHATSRSLVILDEIGRGTSTYDGLAIAQAVAEHLHNHPQLGCRTLFATHYHEMTDLARYLPRVRNAHVTVTEDEGRVIFLHRVAPGTADRSYGVHVAQLAGMPRPVVHRAWELLEELEQTNGPRPGKPRGRKKGGSETPQLSLSGLALEQLRDELVRVDVAALSPLEALNLLYRLQEIARDSSW